MGTAGNTIQDQHLAQHYKSCENPMHGAYTIFGKFLGKLESWRRLVAVAKS
jgi:hypothetical protein